MMIRYSTLTAALAATCFFSADALAQQVREISLSSKVDEYILKPVLKSAVRPDPVPQVAPPVQTAAPAPYIPPVVEEAYVAPAIVVEPAPAPVLQQVYVEPVSFPEPVVIQEYFPAPTPPAPQPVIAVQQPYVPPSAVTETVAAVPQAYAPPTPVGGTTTAVSGGGGNLPLSTIAAPAPSSLPPVNQIASATLVGNTPTGFVPLLGAAAPFIAGAAGAAGIAAAAATANGSSASSTN